MNKLLTVFAGSLFIVASLVGCDPPAPVNVQSQTLPTSNSTSDAEATGERLVDVIDISGTRRPTNQQIVNGVTAWLQAHPGYRIEVMTPATYHGGGDSSLRSHTYLVIAVRDTAAQK
jgi:hypothetical protein